MIIVHRISLTANADQLSKLKFLGVNVGAFVETPGGGDPFVGFDVAESHPNWPLLALMFQKWSVSDLVSTEFSKQEIERAEWLNVSAWHHGYPQPDDDFGYMHASFDLTDWCKHCGIGIKQIAPIRMKGEPKWGRNGMLQLIWLYSELFVTPEVWAAVFKPFGVGFLPVLNKKGAELLAVVQLKIEATAGLVISARPQSTCACCGRVKYLPVTNGPFPILREMPKAPILHTAEYFGSGAQANQSILISQNIASALRQTGVRGGVFQPVGLGADNHL